MKKIMVLCVVFGLMNIALGLSNPVEGENLFVMFGLGIIGWTAIMYRVNKSEI